MHIDHVSYGRTFNLGKFESERVDASAAVSEDEQDILSLIYAQLRRTVEDAHKAAEEARKAEVDKK